MRKHLVIVIVWTGKENGVWYLVTENQNFTSESVTRNKLCISDLATVNKMCIPELATVSEMCISELVTRNKKNLSIRNPELTYVGCKTTNKLSGDVEVILSRCSWSRVYLNLIVFFSGLTIRRTNLISSYQFLDTYFFSCLNVGVSPSTSLALLKC